MLHFDRIELPEQAEALRAEVRSFLASESAHLQTPNADFSSGHDPEFSRKLGAQGWIGMAWPKEYGGAERSFFERYVVTEELLTAGAPVSGRSSGFGNRVTPRIVSSPDARRAARSRQAASTASASRPSSRHAE